MGFMETHRISEEGVRTKVAIGECVVEDMGEVQISVTDYIA
jgi:hypothetical protein